VRLVHLRHQLPSILRHIVAVPITLRISSQPPCSMAGARSLTRHQGRPAPYHAPGALSSSSARPRLSSSRTAPAKLGMRASYLNVWSAANSSPGMKTVRRSLRKRLVGFTRDRRFPERCVAPNVGLLGLFLILLGLRLLLLRRSRSTWLVDQNTIGRTTSITQKSPEPRVGSDRCANRN
jgi:hypothetical protein